MKPLWAVMVVAICVLAAGCGSAGPAAAPSAPAVTLIPPPTANVAATDAPNQEATVTGTTVPRAAATPLATLASADVLLVYHKSGCFTGIKDVLTVWQDGTLQLVNRSGQQRKSSVSADRLTTVKQLIAQPEFAQLNPLYQAAGADLCVYSITTRLADGTTRSVTTMDAAPTPPLLMQVVKEVDGLWKAVQ